MKRKFEIALMIACVAGIFYSTFAPAQNVNYSRKYRVIAYKNGNPSITSVSNETTVVPTISLYVPNTFTPNGDGLNDTFGAYGEAIKGYTMEIYDRWGAKIWSTDNANQKWNGQYKGQLAPQGSYAYKIVALGPDGKTTTKKGSVNLIR